MVQPLILIVLLFATCLTPSDVCADSESVDVSNVLNTRQVVGVVHFKQDRYELTRQVQAEVDKLVVSAKKKRSKHGILRIEGFVSKADSKVAQLDTSMKRARTVWNYLRLRHKIIDDIYLTGFDSSQTISKMVGSRVEIVVYANPFTVESANVAKIEGN